MPKDRLDSLKSMMVPYYLWFAKEGNPHGSKLAVAEFGGKNPYRLGYSNGDHHTTFTLEDTFDPDRQRKMIILRKVDEQGGTSVLHCARNLPTLATKVAGDEEIKGHDLLAGLLQSVVRANAGISGCQPGYIFYKTL